jgi:hypothetical protein
VSYSKLGFGVQKNEWSNTSIPQYAFMAWCSVKAQGKLYLYLLLISMMPNKITHLTQMFYISVSGKGSATRIL